jgi:hypothetical protein
LASQSLRVGIRSGEEAEAVSSNDKQQLIFKQAISTIQPEKPSNWKQQEK